MNQQEMVTDFKLTDHGEPCEVAKLMHALNRYLKNAGLEPEESDFRASRSTGPYLPKSYRWLISFAVEGSSEGYYIHVGALHSTSSTYTELGLAKTCSADKAYCIAREAQRFLTASAWN